MIQTIIDVIRILFNGTMDLKVKEKTSPVLCLLMTDAVLVYADKGKKADLILFGLIGSEVTLVSNFVILCDSSLCDF